MDSLVPLLNKNADMGSSANVRRTEGDAVEAVVPDQLGIHILHAGGYGGYDQYIR